MHLFGTVLQLPLHNHVMNLPMQVRAKGVSTGQKILKLTGIMLKWPDMLRTHHENKETRYAIILYFIAILNNDRAKIPIQTLIIFQCVKQSTRFLRISTFQQKNNQI